MSVLRSILALTLVCAAHCASATPRQLDCLLTDSEVKADVESRSLVVTFDEQQATLSAEASGQLYDLKNASISNASMSGQADDVSLGIDRSSLGIVWQHYEAGKVSNEFGHCTLAAAPG